MLFCVLICCEVVCCVELCVARHIVVVLGLSVVPGGRKGGELQGGGGSMMICNTRAREKFPQLYKK